MLRFSCNVRLVGALLKPLRPGKGLCVSVVFGVCLVVFVWFSVLFPTPAWTETSVVVVHSPGIAVRSIGRDIMLHEVEDGDDFFLHSTVLSAARLCPEDSGADHWPHGSLERDMEASPDVVGTVAHFAACRH